MTINKGNEQRSSVLIVEDENIVAMNLKMMLTRFGFDIAGHARTGEAAVEMAKETEPDLIIMDIQLGGGIDGIQAADNILKSQMVPIIFASGNSDKATMERANRVCTDGYLVKPYLVDQLHAAVHSAISR